MTTKTLLTAVFATALAVLQGVEFSYASEQPGTTTVKLRAGGFAVGIDRHGMPGDPECPDGQAMPAAVWWCGGGALRRDSPVAETQPATIAGSGDAVSVEYELPGAPKIHVSITYRLQAEGKTTVLVREVAVRAERG